MTVGIVLAMVLLAGAGPESGTCRVAVTANVDSRPTPGVELSLREGSVINFGRAAPELASTITDKAGQAGLDVPRRAETYVIAHFPGAHQSYVMVSCDAETATVSLESPSHVSLLQLITNPEKWHGRVVQFIGYLNLEFEGNGVYVHKEDYKRRISRNAIWVDLSLSRMGELSRLSGKYVIIRGRFDGSRHGHMGAYSGLLHEISRCEAWQWD